jgi:multidrug efflux system membrane fusion protein
LASDIPHPPVVGPDHQLPAHVPGTRRPRALRVALAGLVALAIAVAIVLAVRYKRASTAKPPAQPRTTVTAVTAQKGDIGVYLDAIGTVTPVYTAQITSQVTGLIVLVHYQQGQRVQKGDPLIDIDSRPFRATLMQALGVLKRDENVLAQARMDLERYRAAWAKNAIAKQTLDDQEKIVLQDEGTVKNDRGVVAFDEVQVGFCYLTSPIVGRVGLRLVDPGNVVQANGTTALVVVTQIEPITVVFTIAEDSLGPVRQQLARGAKLDVLALDRTGQKLVATGTLAALDNQIDTTTGTVRARAEFPNSDDALFPNQFVNTRLLVDTHHGVTLIASSAVQQNGPESYVYVLTEGVAHLRRIRPRVTDRGLTEVEGVDPGDLLADSSFDRLHDGAAITVRTAPPPAPSGSSRDAAP